MSSSLLLGVSTVLLCLVLVTLVPGPADGRVLFGYMPNPAGGLQPVVTDPLSANAAITINSDLGTGVSVDISLSTFDSTNRIYFSIYVAPSPYKAVYQLNGFSIDTRNHISSTSITSNVASIEFSNSQATLYAIVFNPQLNRYAFCQLDPLTGISETMTVLSNAVSIAAGVSTYDDGNGIYYAVVTERDGNAWLYGIDVIQGQIVSRTQLSQGIEVVSISFDLADNLLLGVAFIKSSTNDFNLISINPTSGAWSSISILPPMRDPVLFSSAVDKPAGNVFITTSDNHFFGGASLPQVLTINAKSGFVLGNSAISKPLLPMIAPNSGVTNPVNAVIGNENEVIPLGITGYFKALSPDRDSVLNFVYSLALSAKNGYLFLGSVTPPQNQLTADLTITGNAVNINAALVNLYYLGNLYFHGQDSIVMKLSDPVYNAAISGSAVVDTKTAIVTVTAVNQIPMIIGTAAQVSIDNKCQNFVFSSMSVFDPDCMDSPVCQIDMAISVSNGVLKPMASKYTDGSTSSSSFTWAGTPAELTTALKGSSFLLSQASGISSGSITFSMGDRGNTGAGGERKNTFTVNISVQRVGVVVITSIFFNQLGTGLEVNFCDPTNSAGNTGITCDKIFDATDKRADGSSSLSSISGSSSATCSFENPSKLLVLFGGFPTIKPGDIISVLGNSGIQSAVGTQTLPAGKYTVQASPIAFAPTALITAPTTIDKCSGLTLDGALSTGGAGRALTYQWNITNIQPLNTVALSSIMSVLKTFTAQNLNQISLNSTIVQPNYKYTFSLVVVNFLNKASSPQLWQVHKSPDAVPTVSIRGPATFQTTNEQQIIIRGKSVRSNCDNAGALQKSVGFSYQWLSIGNKQFTVDSNTYQTSELTIFPFTLGIGTYLLQFQATSGTTGSALMTIVVVPQLLSPIISGGDRYASMLDNVVIDASLSYDPNIKNRGDPQLLSYSYSCSSGNTVNSNCPMSSYLDAASSGATNALGSPTVAFPGSLLTANLQYTITLKVKKMMVSGSKYIADPMYPPDGASTQAVLTALNAKVVNTTIVMSPYFALASVNTPLNFNAVTPSNVKLWTWKVVDTTTNVLVPSSYFSTLSNRVSFGILAGKLTASHKYTVSLNVTDTFGFIGSAVFVVTISGYPISTSSSNLIANWPGDPITVPSAVSTIVTLKALGWSSFDASSLVYSFWYIDQDAKGNQVKTSLGSSADGTLDTFLPVPYVSGRYASGAQSSLMTIGCTVLDRLNGTTDSSIKIKLAFNSNDFNQQKRFDAVIQVQNFITDANLSGDFDRAFAALTALSTVYSNSIVQASQDDMTRMLSLFDQLLQASNQQSLTVVKFQQRFSTLNSIFRSSASSIDDSSYAKATLSSIQMINDATSNGLTLTNEGVTFVMGTISSFQPATLKSATQQSSFASVVSSFQSMFVMLLSNKPPGQNPFFFVAQNITAATTKDSLATLAYLQPLQAQSNFGSTAASNRRLAAVVASPAKASVTHSIHTATSFKPVLKATDTVTHSMTQFQVNPYQYFGDITSQIKSPVAVYSASSNGVSLKLSNLADDAALTVALPLYTDACSPVPNKVCSLNCAVYDAATNKWLIGEKGGCKMTSTSVPKLEVSSTPGISATSVEFKVTSLASYAVVQEYSAANTNSSNNYLGTGLTQTVFLVIVICGGVAVVSLVAVSVILVVRRSQKKPIVGGDEEGGQQQVVEVVGPSNLVRQALTDDDGGLNLDDLELEESGETSGPIVSATEDSAAPVVAAVATDPEERKLDTAIHRLDAKLERYRSASNIGKFGAHAGASLLATSKKSQHNLNDSETPNDAEWLPPSARNPELAPDDPRMQRFLLQSKLGTLKNLYAVRQQHSGKAVTVVAAPGYPSPVGAGEAPALSRSSSSSSSSRLKLTQVGSSGSFTMASPSAPATSASAHDGTRPRVASSGSTPGGNITTASWQDSKDTLYASASGKDSTFFTRTRSARKFADQSSSFSVPPPLPARSQGPASDATKDPFA